jgi:ATP phosphoribosyltransferase
MSNTPLVLGLPSKGRLMETTAALLQKAGLELARTGHARGYQGVLRGLKSAPELEVAFLSASEIARHLREGKIAAGVTGEDLLQESIARLDEVAARRLPLGFGHADVVVAVPECWLDCARMSDLEEIAEQFHANHGHLLRVATKYLRLTRRFFAEHGVAAYRTVRSAGATEGAPAAGLAEIIVDITSTGSTLKANRLKGLDDGTILRSQAMLATRNDMARHDALQELNEQLGGIL